MLPTPYQSFIHMSRYSRFDWEKNRRESWEETVDRLMNFWKENPKTQNIPPQVMDKLRNKILNLEIMPSMRTLMSAGKALNQNHIAGYNCSYVAVNDIAVFGEILYILTHGTGVGFSVSKQHVKKLPTVPKLVQWNNPIQHVVEDSKEGWKHSVDMLISNLYQGKNVEFDYSKVRPMGAPLKTFGGRASGPEPLQKLHQQIRDVFLQSVGRKLNPFECHLIICSIGNAIVVGGVRRSALISLSDLDDDEMRDCKSGQWWLKHLSLALANNSVVYYDKPSFEEFQQEWKALQESGTGERGIFSMLSAKKSCDLIDRKSNYDFGTNPCGEIILRDAQFCNLSEVCVREEDTIDTLLEKVRYATILGTMQSSLDKFNNLRPIWTKNTQEERLLGVSLTGIMDNNILNGEKGSDYLKLTLQTLRQHAKDINLEYAELMDISPSTAITTIKPSGTVSQLCNTSSGIHPRHAHFYLRRVRVSMTDPIVKVLQDHGIPCDADKSVDNTLVFTFPQRSPETSKTRKSFSALEFLEVWKIYKKHYTDHNPSVTVSIRDHEWKEVGKWVYENWEFTGGLSFLPYSDTTYRQLPYEEISRDVCRLVESIMPNEINWTLLSQYETTDNTVSRELACTGEVCEI